MRNELTVVIVSLFMLALLGFVPLVWNKAQHSHEQKLDRICDQQESKWGFLAPPMERNDVWMAREQAERKMCAARREDGDTG